MHAASTPTKMNDNQSIISAENNIIRKLIHYQKAILCILLVAILSVPIIQNYSTGKPLIMGSESYYHLLHVENQWHFAPLSWSYSLLGFQGIAFVPLILGLFTILLFLQLAKQLNLSRRVTFFFLLFALFTPSFIYTFSTLSAASYFTFLVVLAFTLLTNGKKRMPYISIIPFALTAFFDIASLLIVLLLLAFYTYTHRKESHKTLALSIFLGLALLGGINALLTDVLFVLGPFHQQHYAADAISDLGGLSGISLFIAILAFIGIAVTWKRPQFSLAYVFIISLILLYMYSTQTVFYLSIVILIVASIGFLKLFDSLWILPTLKKFTFFILLLGILFSALTYIDRLPDTPPMQEDVDALLWLKENSLSDSIILSAPENGYFIQFFAQRTPFATPDEKEKQNVTQQLFSASYVQDLFPILEQEYITYIYITPAMKRQLPGDQGLRFLLKNERFKLVYSSGDTELWSFKQAR